MLRSTKAVTTSVSLKLEHPVPHPGEAHRDGPCLEVKAGTSKQTAMVKGELGGLGSSTSLC
jgi:hypothetical protein